MYKPSEFEALRINARHREKMEGMRIFDGAALVHKYGVFVPPVVLLPAAKAGIALGEPFIGAIIREAVAGYELSLAYDTMARHLVMNNF